MGIEEEKDIKSTEQNPRDAMLIMLAEMSNKADMEMGLTLIIGGSVISGRLISGKKYLEAVAEQLSVAGEMGEVLAKLYNTVKDEFFTTTTEIKNVETI